MDSTLDHGPALYNSIPTSPLGPPRHHSPRNTAFHHATRLARSRLVKALTVLTFLVASVFFLSSPCISCDLLTFKHRVFSHSLYPKSVVQRYAPLGYSYFPSRRSDRLGSYSHYHPRMLLRRSSTPAISYWNREDTALPAGDFVIEEWVPTRDCSAGRFCRARLIIKKEGPHVTIQAGYNISGVGGVDRPVDSGTRARVLAVTPDETLRWADALLNRLHDRLIQLDCIPNFVEVAMAIFFSSKAAATCLGTEDPLCHRLTTVENCTYLPPSPVPFDSCEAAFEECQFTFKGQTGLATFSIDGPADKSFTPVVVAKEPGVTLGVLNSNNVVPEFIEDSGAFPITDFGSQPFTPTQFKPYYVWQEQGSGIGHQIFHADQQELARGRCVRIYFTEVQLVDPYSNLNNVPISENKCVVFRTG